MLRALSRIALSRITLAAVLTTSACVASPDAAIVREAVSVFPPGDYLLGAWAVSSFPTDNCVGTGSFVGLNITSFVTVTWEGDVFVVRSTTPADGDIDFRLALAPVAVGTPSVSGSARGSMIDRAAGDSSDVATLTFGNQTTAKASLGNRIDPLIGPDIDGPAVGQITVSSSLGHGSCEQAGWAIRKP
jgi:hypothetical protein